MTPRTFYLPGYEWQCGSIIEVKERLAEAYSDSDRVPSKGVEILDCEYTSDDGPGHIYATYDAYIERREGGSYFACNHPANTNWQSDNVTVYERT